MGQTKSVVAELLQANYNFIVFLGIRYQHCCLQTKVDTFGNNSIYLFCSLIMCHYFNGLILFFVVSEKLTKIYGILEASSSKHRRASSILIKPPIVFAHACVHLSLRMSKFFFYNTTSLRRGNICEAKMVVKSEQYCTNSLKVELLHSS